MNVATIILSISAIVLTISLTGIILVKNIAPHRNNKKSDDDGHQKGGGTSGGGGSSGGGTSGGGGSSGGQEKSKYLNAYVEDCGQASSLVYNMEQLKNLDIIGLDFSLSCYNHVNSTLSELRNNNYEGKVFVHFDQTNESRTCGDQPTEDTLKHMNGPEADTIMNSCYKTLKDNIDKTNLQLIKGILWEQEANKFVNKCASEDWCVDFWKKYDLEFAGWLTKYDFTVPLSGAQSNWDYAFYEYYNIFTNVCQGGVKVDGCEVDYNPPGADKCFPGALSGPNSKIAGCGKGAVYCDDLTPSERGAWMAKVLIDARKNIFLPADSDASKKVIYFTFTTGSNPSFYQTITKASQFDEFIEAFVDALAKAGVTNMQDYKIGVWGCPKWMGEGSSTISFC